MCAKCCAVHVVGGNNEACNIATHKKRAAEKIANDGIDDNIADDGEGEGRVNEDGGPGNNAAEDAGGEAEGQSL
jgi:hypothetical protein